MTTYVFLTAIVTVAIIAIVAIYALIRNEMVYQVRISFIDDPVLYPERYDSLPPYAEMLEDMKHTFRWSKGSWVKYLENKV